MKNILIAVLASLMMAGVLAGASEPIEKIAPSAVFALGAGSPILVNAPLVTSYGDSILQ